MLHIVNSASASRPLTTATRLRGRPGRDGAVVVRPQRVGFFLTAGFLGDVLLRAPSRPAPVYSYRLSVVHFWALIFIYIWAGPHHLHYTSLPDWAQSASACCSR